MIEFTVPLPGAGVQYLDHRKAYPLHIDDQWVFKTKVKEAAERLGIPPLDYAVLAVTVRCRVMDTDRKYRPKHPWMVGVVAQYVALGLNAADVLSLEGYALVCRIERVDSLAEEGIRVSVRPIEEEAE